MSRRSRVKPVANLRSRNSKRSINVEENPILNDVTEDNIKITKNSESDEIFEQNVKSAIESSEEKTQEKEENANSEIAIEKSTTESISAQEEDTNNTFKKPQTRAEESESNNESNAGQTKSRLRLKIQPRLGITRNSSAASQKSAEIIAEKITKPVSQSDKNEKEFEESPATPITIETQQQGTDKIVVRNLFDLQPQSGEKDLQSTVASTPNSVSIGSPFTFPHPPSRIRTESLCSIKSNISGMGGVVRKNFRSEENQRIIDTKRESKARLSNKNLDKTQLLMFDMIYFNPVSNPMTTSEKTKRDRSRSATPALEIPEKPIEPEIPEPSNNCLVPQVKLGPNGELILDERSLIVENEEQKKSRIMLANANVVYDDELSGTYGYYKRQKRTKEWQPEETIKFYRCLQTIGTDFSLMLQLFPERSRRDLKLKFKKEEKNNMALIDKALMHPKTFDIDELKQSLDYDDMMRKKDTENKTKAEVNAKLKKEILKKQAAKAKKRSKVERTLTDADLASEIVDSGVLDSSSENPMCELTNLTKEPPPKRPRRNTRARQERTQVSSPEDIEESTLETPAKPPTPCQSPNIGFEKDSSSINIESNNNSLVLYENSSNEIGNEKLASLSENLSMDVDCPLSPNSNNDIPSENQTSSLQSNSEIPKPQEPVKIDEIENSTNEPPVPSKNRRNAKRKLPNLQQRNRPSTQDTSQDDVSENITSTNVPPQKLPEPEQTLHSLQPSTDSPAVQSSSENQEVVPVIVSDGFMDIVDAESMFEAEQELCDTTLLDISAKEIIQDMESSKVDEVIVDTTINTTCDIENEKLLLDDGKVQQEPEKTTADQAIELVYKNIESILKSPRPPMEEECIIINQQSVIEKPNTDQGGFENSESTNQNSVEQEAALVLSEEIKETHQSVLKVPATEIEQTKSAEITEEPSEKFSENILDAPIIMIPEDDPKSQEKFLQLQQLFFGSQKKTEDRYSPMMMDIDVELSPNSAKADSKPGPSGVGDKKIQETQPGPSKSEEIIVIDDNEEDESKPAHDDDYYDNLLNDIDLNSLVLVESQVNDKLIHEIYIMDPATEKLSEKPLDLPADIIENIRRVLNSEENDGAGEEEEESDDE